MLNKYDSVSEPENNVFGEDASVAESDVSAISGDANVFSREAHVRSAEGSMYHLVITAGKQVRRVLYPRGSAPGVLG